LCEYVNPYREAIVLNIFPILIDLQVTGVVCSFEKMQQFEFSVQKLKPFRYVRQQLETLLSISTDGIWVFDSQGIVIKVNKAAEVINGIRAEDVIGKSYQELIRKNGLYKKSVIPNILKKKLPHSNLDQVKATGNTVLITGTPIFCDDDKTIDLIVVNEKDLTEIKKMETQLEESRKVTAKYEDEISKLSMLTFKNTDIIAESKKMRQVITMAIKLAHSDVPSVLVTGESGTGKGLISKFIHHQSSRQKKPFIQINCATIPENLLEAELFGYDSGAFTGASKQGKAGLIELAHKGTLFLDEIGELPLSLQSKLLKYLDDREIMRLGGTHSKKIDCAVIAATNRNLDELIRAENFRQDLYFRLNIFDIRIPPLRERQKDIFSLIYYFLDKYNQQYKKNVKISKYALEQLQSHQFPGNVRELENLIMRSVVMNDDRISKIDMRQVFPNTAYDIQHLPLKEQLARIEGEIIAKTIKTHKTTRAIARHLGIGQSSVVNKMKKYGLSTPKRS